MSGATASCSRLIVRVCTACAATECSHSAASCLARYMFASFDCAKRKADLCQKQSECVQQAEARSIDRHTSIRQPPNRDQTHGVTFMNGKEAGMQVHRTCPYAARGVYLRRLKSRSSQTMLSL